MHVVVKESFAQDTSQKNYICNNYQLESFVSKQGSSYEAKLLKLNFVSLRNYINFGTIKFEFEVKSIN